MLRAMKARRPRTRCTIAFATGFSWLLFGSTALADEPLDGLGDGLALGEWTFHPFVDLRLRAEYRRAPTTSGGDVYSRSAVQADSAAGGGLDLFIVNTPRVDNEWFVGERTRLGLAVDRDHVTAKITLQDARVAGADTELRFGPSQPTLPSTEPHEAYLDLHTEEGGRMFLRLGRQRVQWGDGRLLSDDDDSPTGRHLDAARAGAAIGDVDVEILAAVLTVPGALPPEVRMGSTLQREGSGTQLYGLDAVWHVMPLLHAEVLGLARFVREPTGLVATPGDTYVLDGRVFGDHRGFSYSIEGAYEAGRLASFGQNRDISAGAVAGRAALETTLPWHLTFGASGAYATGAGSADLPSDTQARFDPILPDAHNNHGPAGFYAWSNIIEAGGDVSARPIDEVRARAGYRFVGLAEPDGRWSTASLQPVGTAPRNDSRVLGHQVDAVVTVTPWAPLSFDAAYGVLFMGDGGEAILDSAGRPRDASHWVMLQSRLMAP